MLGGSAIQGDVKAHAKLTRQDMRARWRTMGCMFKTEMRVSLSDQIEHRYWS